MIPKIIHYCWFGGNPLPPLAVKCIKSWEKHCPDYEIVRWDETNYEVSSAPPYVRQAYEQKKWAFVSDYTRLQIIYENGGVYLDTDVEVRKSLNPFLKYAAFFGIEEEEQGVFVATGLGFGAERRSPALLELMQEYQNISFVFADGTLDTTPCPVRNTNALRRLGYVEENRNQTLPENIAIFASDYFCPKSYQDGKIYKTKNTVTIHHFNGSWHTKEQSERKQARWHSEKVRRRKNLPFRIARRILGENVYNSVREKLKR